MAFLRIKNGPSTGRTLPLRKGTLRIGRSLANDIQIWDPSVSDTHCEVAVNGAGNLFVRDHASMNGTFLEGQRIQDALIKPGQTLRLGNVELLFENTDPTTLPAPIMEVRAQLPQARDMGPTDDASTRLEAHQSTGVLAITPAVSGVTGDLTATFVVTTVTGECKPLSGPEGHASLNASCADGVTLQQRYVLERELGRGGMGQVFLARDIRLNRPVAIKVILPARGSLRNGSPLGRELRQAFELEARLGANLSHAAIATVFDYGFHDDKP